VVKMVFRLFPVDSKLALFRQRSETWEAASLN
jgi:hypothetical protein